MRNLMIALSLVLVSSSAHAQFCTVAEAAGHPGNCSAIVLSLSPESRMAEAKHYDEERRSAVILRDVGIVSTIVGTALTVAGSVVMFNAFANEECSDDCGFVGGAAMLGLGQAAVVAGTVMWATGGVRASRAERSVQASAGGLKVTF